VNGECNALPLEFGIFFYIGWCASIDFSEALLVGWSMFVRRGDV
jgi:hypothetical protein